MMQTQAQRDLILAEQLVSDVEREQEEVRKIYGGLCHSFPVLVRTCGLCQALAFSKEKETASDKEGPSNRNTAHRLLLRHVAAVLDAQDPFELVRKVDVVEYMRNTHRILSAWIYFKRFAVSILKVADSRAAEEGG